MRDPRWLVSYDDDDDRRLDAPAIASELRRGAITEDTIVWREGMGDWVPIAEVPELQELVPKAPAGRRPSQADHAREPRRSPGSNPFLEDDEPDPEATHQSTHATSDEEYEVVTSVRPEMLGKGEPPAAAIPPPPPRAAHSEPAPGSAASSDDEGELSTSVRPGMLEGVEAPVVPPAPPPPAIPVPDDERPPSLPSAARISAPANEGGGPAPAPAGDAPPVIRESGKALPAPSAAKTAPAAAPPESRGRGLLWVLLLAIVVAAIVAALVLLRRHRTTTARQAAEPRGAAASPDTPAATPPAAQPVPRRASTSEPASPASSASAGAPPASSNGDFFRQFAAAAQGDSPPTTLHGFDEKRTLQALTGQLGHAASCRRRGDPTGTAMLRITLDPSGKVTDVAVSGPLAGTPTARCIIGDMKAARVPPFSGSAAILTHPLIIR